jgi:hypothetical protein
MSLVESEVNSPSSWKINPGKILALVKAAAAKAQNKPVNFIIKVYKRKEVNEKKKMFGKSEFLLWCMRTFNERVHKSPHMIRNDGYYKSL